MFFLYKKTGSFSRAGREALLLVQEEAELFFFFQEEKLLLEEDILLVQDKHVLFGQEEDHQRPLKSVSVCAFPCVNVRNSVKVC